jgi:hypothetical protein
MSRRPQYEPAYQKVLRKVELVARGTLAPSLTQELKLPNWNSGGFAWPPHRPIDPAFFAPVVIGDPRLTTGDWWKVKQEEEARAAAAAQREEAERRAKSPAATATHADWWKTAEGTARMRAARS